jgi:peptide/nickel transport system substrate-binding protein
MLRAATTTETNFGEKRMERAAAWSFAVLGCLVWTGSATAQTPARGGTLSFAVVAEPPHYDCHSNTTFGHTHPIAPHYSTLLKFHGKFYPDVTGDLAESWTASPDGLNYTFKLHKNVKFHDGSPLTSADVKASYERIISPPQGIVSSRQAYYADFGPIETPDENTVVFTLKTPVAGVLPLLASPFNCIYSAAKLAQNPRYPETEIMGSGAFAFVEHVRGSSWTAKRFDQYFKPDLPYLDGYKALFVKSSNVLPGLLGGQFDAEFRFRSPGERDQLVEKMGDKVWVKEQPLVSALIVIFNTKREPFGDQRVRQALSIAIDRWTAGDALGKISAIKYVGGAVRPGFDMALPESELVKLPGYGKDAAAARAEAVKLLKEAGVGQLSFKLLNRSATDPYTSAGVYMVDQWRRIGVTAQHEQFETAQYQSALSSGAFDVAIEFISDYTDDPTMHFTKLLSKKASAVGYSDHEDVKIDQLYEAQRRAIAPAERRRLVNELDAYAITAANVVPFLWFQRIVVMPKQLKGWYAMPSHYLGQDLSDVWLER